jgi:hypothetical protein
MRLANRFAAFSMLLWLEPMADLHVYDGCWEAIQAASSHVTTIESMCCELVCFHAVGDSSASSPVLLNN